MKIFNTFFWYVMVTLIMVSSHLTNSRLEETTARVQALEIEVTEMKTDMNYLGTLVFSMVEPQKAELGEIK